jgi:hypothetical protein
MVICELWRLAVVLQLIVVLSRVYKWSINLFTNPNPMYSHTPTCDIWCQKWSEWNLNWIVILPYYKNGTDDGTPADQDTCHAGKGSLSREDGGRNEGLQKEMNADQEVMEACPEKMEANPEEMKSVAVHKEVPKEEAAVKTVRTLRKRQGDRHLAIGRCRNR